jgi:hypothetical protein
MRPGVLLDVEELVAQLHTGPLSTLIAAAGR